jgi:hypothetical protein
MYLTELNNNLVSQSWSMSAVSPDTILGADLIAAQREDYLARPSSYRNGCRRKQQRNMKGSIALSCQCLQGNVIQRQLPAAPVDHYRLYSGQTKADSH